MGHFHLIQTQNYQRISINFKHFLQVTQNFTMELTKDQKLALAQRIVDEFGAFVKEEMQYQIDDMKDNDELNWEYYLNSNDSKDIMKLVVDMIAVPVQ